MRVSDRTRPRALQFLCSLLNSDISNSFRKTTFFVSSPDAPESSVITRETEFLAETKRSKRRTVSGFMKELASFERVRDTAAETTSR